MSEELFSPDLPETGSHVWKKYELLFDNKREQIYELHEGGDKGLAILTHNQAMQEFGSLELWEPLFDQAILLEQDSEVIDQIELARESYYLLLGMTDPGYQYMALLRGANRHLLSTCLDLQKKLEKVGRNGIKETGDFDGTIEQYKYMIEKVRSLGYEQDPEIASLTSKLEKNIEEIQKMRGKVGFGNIEK